MFGRPKYFHMYISVNSSHILNLFTLGQAIQEYVSFYNYECFQKKLNDRSPVEYRETVAA
nr:IS3 family transposase [Paenibacillus sp. A9]